MQEFVYWPLLQKLFSFEKLVSWKFWWVLYLLDLAWLVFRDQLSQQLEIKNWRKFVGNLVLLLKVVSLWHCKRPGSCFGMVNLTFNFIGCCRWTVFEIFCLHQLERPSHIKTTKIIQGRNQTSALGIPANYILFASSHTPRNILKIGNGFESLLCQKASSWWKKY